MNAPTVDLAGLWRLTDDSGDYSCDMPIPGDNITAMHAAEMIPDPYWGRNEYDLRWIAEREWTLRRKFTLTEKDVELVVSGLDTICTITVNAARVGTTDNSFRTFRFDLSEAAVVGENVITITFHPSPAEANRLQNSMPFPIPYQEGNNDIPNVNMLRKVQCDYGWDWNIALAPFGLLGDIHVVRAKQPRIERLEVAQTHAEDGVTLHVTAHLIDARGQDVTIKFAGMEQSFTTQTDHPTVSFTVDKPRIWWPAGHGDQPLYDLSVTCAADTTTRKIGLRQMELLTDEDEIGREFTFRINGQRIFARGANWIPADALAGNITPDGTRKLLQAAVDANMNMIRVWGGGRYEADWFYDMCSELGLLVWQDFMFSCNLYPSTRPFLANVRAEVHEQSARLHHHACLALWCGDNELVGALTWFDESRTDRDRYLVNYDRLNRTIEDALLDMDPDAIWWPSSPTPGPLSFGDAWHDDTKGDMHFWSVWHEGRDFEHYRDIGPRFCSEFGFQSYPSIEVIERFAEPQDFNIASPVLEAHQKNAGGNARIAETMFRYFRWPQKFEDFIWLSQVQQGLAIKTAVDHWRSLKPRCMGTLIWQLNDTWPVCSWSSLNHGGSWKLLHHMAQNFYAPINVSIVPIGDKIELRGINDTGTPTDLSVAAFAVNVDGSERALDAADGHVSDDALTILTLDAYDLGAGDMLHIRWTTPDGIKGTDLFAPQPFKTYDLIDPKLGHTVKKQGGKYILTVTAEHLALFVTAQASQKGHFEHNALHLAPKHPAKIVFVPNDPRHVPKFTFRDLYSATVAT